MIETLSLYEIKLPISSGHGGSLETQVSSDHRTCCLARSLTQGKRNTSLFLPSPERENSICPVSVLLLVRIETAQYLAFKVNLLPVKQQPCSGL